MLSSAVEEANNPEVVLGYGLSLIRCGSLSCLLPSDSFPHCLSPSMCSSHDFFLRSHCQRVVDETLAAHMRSCTAFQVHAPSHFASIIVTRMVAKVRPYWMQCGAPMNADIIEYLFLLSSLLLYPSVPCSAPPSSRTQSALSHCALRLWRSCLPSKRFATTRRRCHTRLCQSHLLHSSPTGLRQRILICGRYFGYSHSHWPASIRAAFAPGKTHFLTSLGGAVAGGG